MPKNTGQMSPNNAIYSAKSEFNITTIHESHSPLQNRLLASLPKPEYNHLLPYLELVPMPMGYLLFGAKEHLQFVYFPITATVALMCELESGDSAAIAIVGNEGMVGISSIMGGLTLNTAIVQIVGFSYRLKVQYLKNEVNNKGSLFNLLLCYTKTLITQMSQTAVCNRYHSVEKQLCRFLLQNLDYSSSNLLPITHELIASMIGVRRECVTIAAGNMQRAGIIKYRRGIIEVIDRPKLQKNVCECYNVVKSEHDFLNTILAKVKTSN